MSKRKVYRTIIDKVLEEGKRGPFIICWCKDLGVSVAVLREKWKDEKEPEFGDVVALRGLYAHMRKRNGTGPRMGWRAESARLWRPEDEKEMEEQEE